jgi:16S rRNA (guanine(966)-N(2))-methyltransferase RsmD
MRIISGSARGRKLQEPAGNAIRPTTDMVKESVFNIIQFQLAGRRVLDLFAGTGQLGIEALSRGASAAVFVDESAEALKLVRLNLKAAGFENAAQVVRTDALSFIKSGAKFDIVFLDPPYDTPLLDQALRHIFEFDILQENGIIICESKADRPMPDAEPPYAKGRSYRYGRVLITLYHRNGNPPASNGDR